MRKKYGSTPDRLAEVAPMEISGTFAAEISLYTFLTTELDAGPIIADGFLDSTDWVPDVFWSAWSASEVSALTDVAFLPSTPPASLISLSASLTAPSSCGDM